MLKIGIIGAGRNGTGHARYYASCGRAKVVAVADPVPEARAKLADEVDARAAPDYNDLLADVDAVVISSPNALHREQCIASCRAGKHVFCEKPVGLCGEDARAMADAAESAGIASVVGFSVRCAPTVRTMQRLVSQGEVGRLTSIWSRRLVHMDPAGRAGWRNDPAQSGGLLLEINIHELDWMMMVGGPVEAVYARMRSETSTHPRANDHLWATLSFAGGAVGLHEGSWLSSMPSFFRGLYGTAGGGQTDEWGNGPLLVNRVGENRREIQPDEALDLRAHWLDCIEQRVRSECDLRWGEGVMRVADAVFESARTGQQVPVQRTARRAQ